MSEGMRSEGALSGIRVVDLSRVLGGPFCTQILGDHGADVIKVEPPMGDETRDWGPPFETGANGETIASSYFHGANRNKRCIALDLSSEQGREVVFRLLETADVVVENFKAGTLEKWGMGYDEVLSQRFPRLIHCRITGFGSDGPLGGFPGYDAVIQAMCGLSSVNGTAEVSPIRMGVPIVDLATGMNAAIGINMTLVERERSGRGQLVEATLYDSGVSMVYPHAANWLMSGKLPALTGNQHPNVVPYDMFSTRTKPIFIGVGNNRQFRNMLEVLGRPELADDPRFRNNGERNTNRDALTEVLTALTRDWQCDELSDKLLAAGIPAGPVNNLGEVLDHEHTRHRGMVVEKDGYRGVGPPVKLSRTAATIRLRPAAFAADNVSVLTEAGYTEAEIETLISAGAVINERRR
jgi:crotonobetainyl-CoA:carnitine CoA-transferase CaiB-like acyl-CoA transferase